MDRIAENPHHALAERLRGLRLERRLTLQELAERSGVSRASLSRIENAEVSPTAETLGRLAAAFGTPMTQILAPLDPEFPPLLRREEQRLWRDAETGFARRSVSPPSGESGLELMEGEIPPHRRIAYERPAFPGHEHHLVLLEGALTLTIEGARYELRPGDCLRYRLRGASCFETGDQAARYLIALASR